MNVPFFDFSKIYQIDYPIYAKSLEDVLKRSDFILRDDLKFFESSLADYFNSKYCVGVANGTDAIWLSLMALGIGVGDEVILPVHTYVATLDAILLTGASAIVVDIEDDNSISPNSIEAAISPNTKAVIPVNLNGRCSMLEDIQKLSKKYNFYVVEDNAQGFGAKLGNKMAGTFGEMGTLSFYPAKILGGLGDGGAVLTNSDLYYEKLLELRNHGRNKNNNVVSFGVNSRLDNLQAAILNAKLQKVDEFIEKRRRIASIYFNTLSNCEGLVLPKFDSANGRYYDSFQNFEIQIENRAKFTEHMGREGVGTLIQWAGKGVDEYNLKNVFPKDLLNGKRILSSSVLIPMNHYMSEDDAYFVAKSIKKFFQ